VVPILFLFIGAASGWAAEWIRVASPRAEVYSDAGVRTARQTLDRLEALANVFAAFGRNPARTDRVRVLVFASASEYDRYKPTRLSAGFYQSGPDGDWIGFPAGSGDRVVMHEYTHLLLNRGVTRLPQWLEEGLAEYFSTTRVNGSQVVLGSPIPEHVANLKLMERMGPVDLQRANKQSIHYSDPVEASRFYATSWALVHMLYSDPAFAKNMPRFVEAIDRGDSNPFEESFGVPVREALLKLGPYLNRPALPVGNIELPEPVAGDEREPESKVSAAAMLRLQAELLLDCGKRDEAAKKYNEIARRYPGDASGQEALAFLALAEGRTADATRRFEAIQNTSARAAFEYAMLLRDQGKKSNELLEKTLALNPSHPEAHFLLGVRATDEKRYGDAVEHLREAVALLPRQFSFWHALAFAYHKLGNAAEARRCAGKAERLASGPEEEKMASDLATLTLTLALKSEPKRPVSSTRTPSSWSKPVSDGSATGRFDFFVCDGDRPPRIRVRTASGAAEEFVIADPRKLELRNAAGGSAELQFSCGSQEPAASVRVEFDSATRAVRVIEFLQ